MQNPKKAGSFKLSAATLLLTAAISTSAFGDTGGLRVRLVDSSGNPVAGATVTAQTPESLTVKSGTTGADGEVILMGLDPSDAYEVVVEGSGYQALRDQNIQVTSGKSYTLDYALNRTANNIQEIVVSGGGLSRIVDTTSALVGTDVNLDLT
jgi:uncharacterized membrane protein